MKVRKQDRLDCAVLHNLLTNTFTLLVVVVSSDSWSNPTVTGSQPPPCQGFTFTLVDSERVVLYGGYQPTSGHRANDYFILNLNTKVSLVYVFHANVISAVTESNEAFDGPFSWV